MDKKYTLGALPSPKDPRDFVRPAAAMVAPMPAKFMLGRVPTKDQSAIGACVAFGTSSAKETEATHEHKREYKRLSEGFIYGNGLEDSNFHRGVGSYPREVLKQLQKFGAPTYEDYPVYLEKPYMVERVQSDVSLKPELLVKAADNKIGRYYQVGFSEYGIKEAIFSTKAPVGFTWGLHGWYLSLDENYVLTPGRGSLIGYHWMIFVGWDDELGVLYAQNSWGEYFGDKGIFKIRYADLRGETVDRDGLVELWAIDSEPPKNTLRMKIGSDKYTVEHGGTGAVTEGLMDVACYLDKNDRTQVPIRFVCQAMGVAEEDITFYEHREGVPKKYYPERSYVRIIDRKLGYMITFNMGRPEYMRNPLSGGDNRGYTTDTLPVFDRTANRIFVPVRYVVNAMQGLIEWDEAKPDDITIKF